jgi:diguanylate cyclase (GGDEF)-like protein
MPAVPGLLMHTVSAGSIAVSGGVALVFLLVLAYLQTSVRESLVRLWQAVWIAYFLHMLAFLLYQSEPSQAALFVSEALLFIMGVVIVGSSRAVFEDFRFRWTDGALIVAGVSWAWLGSYRHFEGKEGPIEVAIGVSALMVFAAGRFYRSGKIRDSIGLRLLSGALACWAVLLALQEVHPLVPAWLATADARLGALPRVLLGVSMVVVMFENERRAVQENTLTFATLDIATGSLLTPAEVVPALERMLDRVLRLAKVNRGLLCSAEEWRGVLPSAQRGFDDELLTRIESEQLSETLVELAYRRGGIAQFRHIPSISEPILLRGAEMSERLKATFGEQGIEAVTAISLQTRTSKVGVLIFPHSASESFSAGQLRLLLATAMQIGTTLENYILMHEAQRRTQGYEMLTQIGQVVSSRLDPDEVLRAIHHELGRLFDTGTFYIAFEEHGELRFEFEVREGQVQAKRSRRMTNALTEFILRTGQPLLVRSEFEKTRLRLGLEHSGKMAKCYVGVPILMNGRVSGVIGALNYEREFVYEHRDVSVLQTAAGQLAVAMENARMFAQEQKRSRYLEFLNGISATAISSQDAEQMLPQIVAAIQRNFSFDHVGIGLLDYATKEIEIKADSGGTERAIGRRIALGSGILGRAARTGNAEVVQGPDVVGKGGLLPDARSIASLPLVYGETLLGVLNVETRRERAFGEQDVLLLRTVADLLATALHNAFVFQKMQQQSITDGLTGIKTRRFFLEAVQSEWKRASRSGRPFSVVLLDLDNFKTVNDTMGHLEGDLVLARVGRLLEQKSRQSNVVARYGGDEFVILMPETEAEQARALSDRLRLWIASDLLLSGHRITASFGVASFPVQGSTVEELLRNADTGMYTSKRAGGDRVSVSGEGLDDSDEARRLQSIAAYVDAFMRRERSDAAALEELVANLKRLCSDDDGEGRGMRDAILILNRSSEMRGTGTPGHGDTVAHFAGLVSQALQLQAAEVADVMYAASVHDIGKLLIPARVLEKTGFLTDIEVATLHTHAELGSNILKALPNCERLRTYVRNHHERFDGGGYPDGLRGEEIPLGARIISVADAYVNMITEQPFAPARTEAEALKELESQSGVQFDGMVVRVLAGCLEGGRAARSGR